VDENQRRREMDELDAKYPELFKTWGLRPTGFDPVNPVDLRTGAAENWLLNGAVLNNVAFQWVEAHDEELQRKELASGVMRTT
jgi:hypothetical protein